MTYPASTGRNFLEILSTLDSIQLTAKHQVATPVDWKQGDDCIIVPGLSDDEARGIFKDGWNAFDFIIVSACFLPFEGQSIIVLRLLRVLRIVRLVGTVPELKLIVNTLLKSMPSMGYIAALLSILFYIYAVSYTHLTLPTTPYV